MPAAKVTPEIAEIRGVPVGKKCISPPYHTAFSTPAGAPGVRRQAAGAGGGTADRLQALSRPGHRFPRHLQGHAGDRDHAGLHHHRRLGRRHRRRPAGVRGPRMGVPLSEGVVFRPQRAGGLRPQGQDQDRLQRQDHLGLRDGPAHRLGRRLLQRGPRHDVRPRLHPGSGLPHQPLSGGRGDPGPAP